MINLISNPFVIVLLLLVLVMACLVYLCLDLKRDKDWLIQDLKRKRAEIKYLQEHINSTGKKRKLYTFESGVNRLENVVLWKEANQHLRLTLDDGSLCVVRIPSQYKFIIQDQSEEGTK